jgi:hypothetical protein
MPQAAQTFYQPVLKPSVSGPYQQVSIASAAWLVLADVFPAETARDCLVNTSKYPNRVESAIQVLIERWMGRQRDCSGCAAVLPKAILGRSDWI